MPWRPLCAAVRPCAVKQSGRDVEADLLPGPSSLTETWNELDRRRQSLVTTCSGNLEMWNEMRAECLPSRRNRAHLVAR
jgi:hypothetical protein